MQHKPKAAKVVGGHTHHIDKNATVVAPSVSSSNRLGYLAQNLIFHNFVKLTNKAISNL
jgi:hypothetical protein